MRFIDGFGQIAPLYDGFILDLWGVIHDGVHPLPGAPECLRAVEAAGKRVVLLSNAPRRSSVIATQLERMGIGTHLYDDIMTSGEASYLMLRDRPDAWYEALGDRMFYIGPDRDLGLTEGLPITRVHDPAQASFVLNTGPDYLADPTEAHIFDPLLHSCAQHHLPMICANPDLEVIRGGVRVLCAGSLAVRYMEMGGEARLLGKPDPAIYGPIVERLGMAKDRILAVGDALRTDIAGAAAAGIDSCWVLGGLHGEHLGEDRDAIEAEAAAAGLAPVAAIPRFNW